jgi:cell wall-associated NlpC family hydrolase
VIDPRVTLALGGLADARLEGLVRAVAYRPVQPWRCIAPAAAIRRAPQARAEQLDQLLFGETFEVLAFEDDWAFGQARRDGYVGYVALNLLAEGAARPTHRVAALRAYAFSAPDIKSAPLALFSLNALVRVEATEGRFSGVEGSGWTPTQQLAPIGQFETDPAAVAERFLGAPYQWGGRESLGLDCSGLVQQALYACGRACPRDSDQQAALGRAVTQDELRRGDLVFWRGHVGMMLDGARTIHANAGAMAVSIEPLQGALERIGPASAFRRLEP